MPKEAAWNEFMGRHMEEVVRGMGMSNMSGASPNNFCEVSGSEDGESDVESDDEDDEEEEQESCGSMPTSIYLIYPYGMINIRWWSQLSRLRAAELS